MVDRISKHSSGLECDYITLPHSGGGTNHGPAEHNKGGYSLCGKCYFAILEAEKNEESMYNARKVS